MNKLPPMPWDLDTTNPHLTIPIKVGELVTVMHQWGHEVYIAGQQSAPEAPTMPNAEFLAKRLGRVAKLAGVTMPGGTYEQVAEVAGTILGEIARALENDDRLAALLPGPYYMDPPDGGSVSVMEQLARMAQDAARYRVLRSHVAPRDVSLSMTVPVTDIPPDQTIEQRIDMLCDVAMTTHTTGDTNAR